MRLTPLGPRLLIKRLETPRPKSSLIEIPDTVNDNVSQYAVILAVGAKVTEDVKVGDIVILKEYVGTPYRVTMDEEVIESFVVFQDDVLAVVVEL